MSEEPPFDPAEIILSAADINRACAEAVISRSDADKLIDWAAAQRSKGGLRAEAAPTAPERVKGFNVVTVLYYFGALLMISACAWFLGDKWDVLGAGGILLTTIVYMSVAATLGLWLRLKGYVVAGGLLVTVAVSLTPLLIYSIERLTGFWPAADPGAYKNFYPRIHGSWIMMELGTIAAALFALKFVRFSFLTAPMAFSFWFFSMDVAALLFGDDWLDFGTKKWVSVVVGIITMFVGFVLDQFLRQRNAPTGEDFAFWCYLFGLLAFWGGLTFMESGSEIGRLVYLLINLGLGALALKLKRPVFMVFGVVGVFIYLGHLAWEVFQDSVLFPFVLAFLGLALILVTVLGQHYVRQRMKEAD